MHVAANNGASSSMLRMLDLHSRAAPEAPFIAEERVEVQTLDLLVQKHLIEGGIVFLKIDVQGFEREVLKGASATLARSSIVQLEMSLLPLYEAGPSYRWLVEFMEERGFHLVGLEPGIAAQSGLLLQADGLFATDQATESLAGA